MLRRGPRGETSLGYEPSCITAEEAGAAKHNRGDFSVCSMDGKEMPSPTQKVLLQSVPLK